MASKGIFSLERRVLRGRRTASRIINGVAYLNFLGPKRVMVRNKDHLIAHINDRNSESRWYLLDKEATFLWSLLAHQPTIAGIIDSFTKNRGSKRKAIEKKILSFVEKLRVNGFIELI